MQIGLKTEKILKHLWDAQPVSHLQQINQHWLKSILVFLRFLQHLQHLIFSGQKCWSKGYFGTGNCWLQYISNMKRRRRLRREAYKKNRLRVMLFGLAFVGVVWLATAIPADAYDFNVGDWEGSLFTQVRYSFGLRTRSPRSVQERNLFLVGGQGLLYQTQRD